MWPVEARDAGLAVDPRRVLLATDADPASLELPRGVQALLLLRDVLVVVAVAGFVVTVTFWKGFQHLDEHKGCPRGSDPHLLKEVPATIN